MRVLVTGAAGQLAQAIAARFSHRGEVVPLSRTELDIADEAAVHEAVARHRPTVIVNCAAYNDVDGAEDHAVDALLVNAFGVLSLARAAAAAGATLVHYGTDFVFDGEASRPYVESDPPMPQSHYGLSKLLGEWLAADASAFYVLRVESLFGGARAKSSVDRILEAIGRGEPARVFVDRTVTPSYVDDVAMATEQVVDRNLPFGVYHCVNTGPTSWLGIAEEAARLLGKEAALVRVSVRDVPLKARRPQYCALDNSRLREAGIVMPTWQDALARYIARSLDMGNGKWEMGESR